MRRGGGGEMENLSELKVSELKQVILDLLDTGNPPAILVLGVPGIGKSSVVNSVARQVGRKVIDVRLAQVEYVDIAGIPKLRDDMWEYVQNNLLIEACRSPVILFFDEITQARPATLSAMFRIVLDRELSNGMKLHSRTLVIAAGNDDAGDNFITEMPFALLNRFFVVRLMFDENEFLEWARGSLDERVYRFLSENRNFIYSRELNITPRTWERVSELLKKSKSETVLKLLPMVVRKPLERYIFNVPDFDIDAILKNPELINELSPSEIESVIHRISDMYIRKEIEKKFFIGLLKRIPKALRTKILAGLLKEKIPASEAKEWWRVLNEC